MSDHVEELAKIIACFVRNAPDLQGDIARAIIAAGWRPPVCPTCAGNAQHLVIGGKDICSQDTNHA